MRWPKFTTLKNEVPSPQLSETPDVLRVREAQNRKSPGGRKQTLVVALQPVAVTVAVLSPLTFINCGFLIGMNYHQQKLIPKDMLYR